MHPPDCPIFDYSRHRDRRKVLSAENRTLLIALASGAEQSQAIADTRPVHRVLFIRLCPQGYEYYAGHYRGESFRCLRYLRVGVGGDARVGASPELVADRMRNLGKDISSGLAALDSVRQLPESQQLNETDRILIICALACRIFVEFLTIHPFADGNGHIARFCLLAVFARFGYLIQGWQVEPRPSYPQYPALISEYRNGNHELLEGYVLSLPIQRLR